MSIKCFYASLFLTAILASSSWADWKADANSRIEQYRKRNAQITVLNASGQPISGVSVDINEVKHYFAFGSCFNSGHINDSNYTNFFKKHFEWAVCENESKWYYNEPTQGSVSYTAADSIYSWCNTNGIKMRGHNIFWEQSSSLPSWVTSLNYKAWPQDCNLYKACQSRLNSVIPHFQNKFLHWDVDNEMLPTDSGYQFFDRLEVSSSDVNSRVWMYQRANALDPNCKLFVNEYTGNSFGGFDGTTYANYITTLQNKGAPIHAIGIQGHISSPFGDTQAQSYWTNVLKPLGTKGLPIWATEFDSDATTDPCRAADVDNYMRIVFSDPNTQGILLWGFMVGTTWRASGAWGLVSANGTLNSAGTTYESLLSQWTTKTSGTSDSNGNTSFRGFHGTYQITLSKAGQTTEVHTIELTPDTNTQQFTISTNFSGGGTCSITASAGANGSISPSGTFDVNSGSSQTFTATPNTGYDVNEWKVDSNTVQSGGTTYTLANITAAHTVTVSFKLQTFSVTATAGSNGSISPSGTIVKDYNSSQLFTATPNSGYDVNTWSVDSNTVQSGGTTYTLANITAAHTVTVSFKLQTFSVTATAGSNGSISPSGTIVKDYNSSQLFTATPNSGYDVNTWSVDGNTVQSGGTTYTLTNITTTHTVTVSFKLQTFSVTATAGSNGSISPSGTFDVNSGSSQTFTATPNTGYDVNEWKVDGNTVQSGGTTYTLTNITTTHTVTVSFKLQTFSVTATAGSNGSISPSGTIVKDYNSSQLFTATPNAGYDVNEWKVDGNTVQSGGTTYTLSNITSVHTVAVTFKQIIISISGRAIKPDGNTPVEGVLIETNDVNAVTDVNGHYELLVNYGWSGIVTPQKTGYTFEPNSDTYTSVTHDYNNMDYTATLKTFKIAGFVLESNLSPIIDVNVSAENGGGSSMTDANGYYEVQVDYGWSGRVIPVKYAYAFEPNSRNYTDVNSDMTTDQSYTGTLLAYRISGHIKNECNVPIKGVQVGADNGGQATSDSNGFYEVWVGYAWTGTVTPEKLHWTFEPNHTDYAGVLADHTGQNYLAKNVYDLDCDGLIDIGDVGVMAENWLMSGTGIPGDFVPDGIVNFLDFAEFGAVWLDN